MARDTGFDGPARGHHALGNRDIFTLYQARLYLLDQPVMRAQVSRHYHHPGCILIQAMYNAGARQLFQPGVAFQQAVDQGAIFMPCRRWTTRLAGLLMI